MTKITTIQMFVSTEDSGAMPNPVVREVGDFFGKMNSDFKIRTSSLSIDSVDSPEVKALD